MNKPPLSKIIAACVSNGSRICKVKKTALESLSFLEKVFLLMA